VGRRSNESGRLVMFHLRPTVRVIALIVSLDEQGAMCKSLTVDLLGELAFDN
jgi:hypothetical protein